MDNYIVSARKYRPSTFQSVVGQKSLTQTLKNAIAAQKLSHAYLFCGPRGVGKTTCARIFAKTINCLTPTPEGEACNCCESCRSFNEGRSYNISELDAASNNSVDDIRSLTEQVRIPPQLGHYKVYIIDEVHMLSTQAFNAFLKTLEEPPHHALFILATTEKHKILPTILSRCQIYDFQRITNADIVEHLHYVATSEGAQAETEALSVIAQKADGGMRDALSIFDQVMSYTAGNITYRAVIENLNVLDYEYYFRLVEAFLSHSVPQALLLFNDVVSRGFEAQHFVGGLASHLRDLLVCKDASTLSLLEVAPAVAQRYGEQAKRCADAFLFKAIELSNECDLNYRQSRNKRLLVELMLIRISQWGVTPTGGDSPTPPLQRVAATTTASPTPTAAPVNVPPVATPRPAQATTAAVQPPAPQPAKPMNRVAPKPTISIRKTQPEAVKQEVQTVVVQERNNPFTADALLMAWNAFVETIPTETVLVNTMLSCKPTLLTATQFEVVVDNQPQLERLQNRAGDLITFLRTQLSNTHLTMQLRESEKQERVRAFSQREQFDLMVQENPYLVTFKDTFGLELA